MILVSISGFTTALGLIVAIGAQNIFVLTQGIARRHLVAVPLVCFLCDVVLMSTGILGVGSALRANKLILSLSAAGGALFLACYSFRSLRAAFGAYALKAGKAEEEGLQACILGALGVTLLNPHVYLDSLILMGGIGGSYPLPERWAFLAGVLAASFVWFFGLSISGSLLAPILSKPRIWSIIQIGVSILLGSQALRLGAFAVRSFIEL